MKRAIASILIFAVLSFWIPCAWAEISQDLDPMVPVDAQTTVAEEASVSGDSTGQVSNVVSTADATAGEKKKVEETKHVKSKKSSQKKSSEKKNKKSGSKKSKGSKKSSS